MPNNVREYQWIVFFGEDWGGHQSTGQYLANELAKDWKILWVNSLGLRQPKLNFADMRRIIAKLAKFIHGTFRSDGATAGRVPENVHVAGFILVPFHKFALVRWFNRHIIRYQIINRMRSLGIVQPLVIAACPTAAYVIDDLGASCRVYYCADEHAALPGMDPAVVTMLEGELMKRVDLVVVSSKALLESKAPLHSNVQYLPHGVDYALLSQATQDGLAVPEDMKTLKHPLIGFVGTIGRHLDMEIIRHVAESLLGATVVMIGPIEVEANEPRNVDNIRYLGPRSREQLPQYLTLFDVCIIPYKESVRIKYASPTKLREYLAAGCPVVSTRQQEAELIDGAVLFADSKEEFVQEVRSVLEGVLHISKKEISESVRSHTWCARAAALMKMISLNRPMYRTPASN